MMRTSLRFAVLLAAFGIWSCSGEAPIVEPAAAAKSTAPLRVGDQFSNYSVKLLSGGDWSPVSEGKKATLVNVWATWCVPCREETPEFIKLHEKYSPQGLEVVGISIDSSNHEGKVREFVEEFKVTYAMAHDSEAAIANRFQAPALPFTILLDSTGKVVWVYPGSLTADDRALVEKIEGTLTTRL